MVMTAAFWGTKFETFCLASEPFWVTKTVMPFASRAALVLATDSLDAS